MPATTGDYQRYFEALDAISPELAQRGFTDLGEDCSPRQWRRGDTAVYLHPTALLTSTGPAAVSSIDFAAGGTIADLTRRLDRRYYVPFCGGTILGSAHSRPWLAETLEAATAVGTRPDGQPVFLDRALAEQYVTWARDRFVNMQDWDIREADASTYSRGSTTYVQLTGPWPAAPAVEAAEPLPDNAPANEASPVSSAGDQQPTLQEQPSRYVLGFLAGDCWLDPTEATRADPEWMRGYDDGRSGAPWQNEDFRSGVADRTQGLSPVDVDNPQYLAGYQLAGLNWELLRAGFDSTSSDEADAALIARAKEIAFAAPDSSTQGDPAGQSEQRAGAGTAAGGEVTGLVSAQAYAANMATAFSACDAGVEEFTASLQGLGVSGEAIAAADQAAEAQQTAAAAWQRAHAALLAQDQVAQAYEAAPGAGTRDFVTGE